METNLTKINNTLWLISSCFRLAVAVWRMILMKKEMALAFLIYRKGNINEKINRLQMNGRKHMC